MASYILTNQNSKLIKFILDEINNCTYFNTATLSKQYTHKILKVRFSDIDGELRRSASNRIGRIIRELIELKIIVKHTGSVRSVWKNLYKGKLYAILDERMEQEYFMIKIKK